MRRRLERLRRGGERRHHRLLGASPVSERPGTAAAPACQRVRLRRRLCTPARSGDGLRRPRVRRRERRLRRQLRCGTCAADEMCEAGACQPLCVPVGQGGRLRRQGVRPGRRRLRRHVLSCGTCAAGETCGAVAPFVCATRRRPCACRGPRQACAGKECGTVYDGCGTAAANAIDCGTSAAAAAPASICGIAQPYQCDAPPSRRARPARAAPTWAGSAASPSTTAATSSTAPRRAARAARFRPAWAASTAPPTCVSGGEQRDCPLCDAVPDCSGQSQRRLSGSGRDAGAQRRGHGQSGRRAERLRVHPAQQRRGGLARASATGIPAGGKSCDRCRDKISARCWRAP